MGPPKYEITNFEDPPSNLPFVVPTESLLVASGADDSRLMTLLEQVNHVLLGLCGSVTVESLHSWGAVVEVRGQHCFSSVGQEEGCEPSGSVWGHSQALEDRWDLYNPSSSVFTELVEDVWLESLEDHAIGSFNLTISMWMSDRGPVDPDTISIIEV